MNRCLLVLTLVEAVSLTLPAASAAPAPTGTSAPTTTSSPTTQTANASPLRGWVVDPNMQPITGANVIGYAVKGSVITSLTSIYETGRTVSDDKGRFVLPQKTLFAAAMIDVKSFNAERRTDDGRPVTIVLYEPREIDGSVVDEAGKPIAGATVRPSVHLRGNGKDSRGLSAAPVMTWLTATTDDKGRFRLTNGPRGGHVRSLNVSAPGRADFVGLSPWDPNTGFSVVLEPEGRIAGTIAFPEGASVPVPVTVVATKGLETPFRQPVLTDQEGKFSLGNLASGTYAILVAPGVTGNERWTSHRLDVDVKSGETTHVKLDAIPAGVLDIRVARRGGAPAATEIALGFSRDSNDRLLATGCVTTDETGSLRLPIMPGSYSVDAHTSYWYSDASKPVKVAAGEVVPVRLELVRQPTLKGTVTDAEGEPASAMVQIFPGKATTRSKRDGTFELPYEPNEMSKHSDRRSVAIVAWANGPQRAGFAAVQEKALGQGVTVVLKPPVTIHGKILTPGGELIAGAQVSLTTGYADFGEMRSSKDGEYYYCGLPAGPEFALAVQSPDYVDSEKLIPTEGKGGTTITQDLALRGLNKTIRGTVREEQGRPTGPITIMADIELPDGGMSCGDLARLPCAGPFTLEGVAEGDVEVSALGESIKTATVRAKGGDENVEIIVKLKEVTASRPAGKE